MSSQFSCCNLLSGWDYKPESQVQFNSYSRNQLTMSIPVQWTKRKPGTLLRQPKAFCLRGQAHLASTVCVVTLSTARARDFRGSVCFHFVVCHLSPHRLESVSGGRTLLLKTTHKVSPRPQDLPTHQNVHVSHLPLLSRDITKKEVEKDLTA